MLIKIEQLEKCFKLKRKTVHALDGVTMNIIRGSVTALVGESGCGKTTLAKTVLGFYAPDKGRVFFNDTDITGVSRHRMLVRKNIQIVFQNPFMSFDPRFSVFAALYEAIRVFSAPDKKTARERMTKLLRMVGLGPECLERFPHQLSGGQLQRVAIARALINNPEVVILDEPTSSLDVSTTVRIIALLEELKERSSVSYLFISHNLKLVRKISDYVYVMYRGKIVESGTCGHIYHNPLHPYTRLLLKASEYKITHVSMPHSPAPGGCVFKEQCAERDDECDHPFFFTEPEKGHYVLCHRSQKRVSPA